MEFTPGDRVELVATTDPSTCLRPGDRGTVTHVTDHPERTIAVHWDDGSTLAILPDTADRIRLLPSDAASPASSSITPEDPSQPRYPRSRCGCRARTATPSPFWAAPPPPSATPGAAAGDRRLLR